MSFNGFSFRESALSQINDRASLFLEQREYSPQTVRAYLSWIEKFESHFPDRNMDELKPDDIASFFQYQGSRQLGSETIRQGSSALRFLFGEVFRRTDLMNAVPRIKPFSPKALVPTQGEIFLIINSVEGSVFRTIFFCIYGMGLELQEARNLRVRDVNFVTSRICVKSQRSKISRSVPIPMVALEELRKLYDGASKDRFLFSMQSNKQYGEKAISRSWTEARHKAGVETSYTMRSLRHAYILHLEMLGIRLVDVLKHVGLRRMGALEQYAKYSASNADIDFSPADRALYDIKLGNFNAMPYVSEARLTQLALINSTQFDFMRLLALLQELNAASRSNNLLSVAFLVRAIIDHVPPIFGFHTFTEVVNNYSATKSFKKSMEHLNISMRNIADGYLHAPIRHKEELPHPPQVDFRAAVDQLLGEICRVLTQKK